MPSDRLLERLITDLKPVRRRSATGDALMFAALCVIELILFLVIGAARPDVSMAMGLLSFWAKLASLGVIALLGGAVAIGSLDPVASPRRGLQWLLGIVVVCLAAASASNAFHGGLPAFAVRVNWPEGVKCVYKIVLLSVPPVVGLGLLMRRGAPTDTGGTALAVGLAAAAWGAFVFVFACPHDDLLYVAVWYAVGCGLVTLVSRLVLPRLTRW